jgi:asparagine N-glycosylation enzyme membrane subunit Stt3
MKLLIFIGIAVWFFWYKPFDECRDYSNFNCDQIENADYNVWIYPDNSDNKSYNIGTSSSLSQCSDIANSYAYKKNLDYGWGYVCCMKTEDSECYEKHR